MSQGLLLGARTRRALLLATSAGALAFGWAAWDLPSRPATPLGLVLGLLSAVHASTLLIGALRPRALARAVRALSALSLASGAVFVGAIAWTCVDLSRRFGSLGAGVSALLGAIAVLLLASTWPLGIWGLCLTRRRHGAA